MTRLINSKSQSGLAPVIIIIGLLSLGAAAAGGYYFVTQKSEPELAQPGAQTPSPSVISQGSTIEEVKEIHEESLLNMEGVENVEVGEKDGKPCIVVFSFEETDELQNLEETGLDGYQVKIENASR